MLRFLALGAGAVLGAVAVLAAGPAAADDAKVARGRQLYTEQRCVFCHSAEGKGNKKGPHDDVGRRLSADEMRQWLLDPVAMARKAKAHRKPPMIPFVHLPPEDVDALVAYLQTLKRKP